MFHVSIQISIWFGVILVEGMYCTSSLFSSVLDQQSVVSLQIPHISNWFVVWTKFVFTAGSTSKHLYLPTEWHWVLICTLYIWQENLPFKFYQCSSMSLKIINMMKYCQDPGFSWRYLKTFCKPAAIMNTGLEPVLNFNIQTLMEIRSTPDFIAGFTYQPLMHKWYLYAYLTMRAGEETFGESYYT